MSTALRMTRRGRILRGIECVDKKEDEHDYSEGEQVAPRNSESSLFFQYTSGFLDQEVRAGYGLEEDYNSEQD